MKKIGKFLVGAASVAAITGGAFYLVKKFMDKKNDDIIDDEVFDDDFEIDDEEDDFEEIFSDNKDEREYVTINITDEDKKVEEVEETEETKEE